MSCRCVGCVSSFTFSTRLAAASQRTSSEACVSVWASGRRAAGSHSSPLVCSSDCRDVSSVLALRSHLIPPRPSLLFFPSQGQHQSECPPLAAPFVDLPPSGGSRSSLGDPDRKSSYVFTFCPCTACAHARMPELACTPARMHVHSRYRIKTMQNSAITAVHRWNPPWGFPPEPFGRVGFVHWGAAEGTRRPEVEALQVSCVFTDFGMERYIGERTVSNSFFSLVSRWQC